MTKEASSIQHSQTKSIANLERQQAQNAVGAHVTDNRPEAIMQRQLQALANTSIPSTQLKTRVGNLSGISCNDVTIDSKTPIVQREINRIVSDVNNNLLVTKDNDRPRTNLPPSQGQGDHLTPWTVIQDQVINCIAGKDLATAWHNLAHTYNNVYQNLPGWATSSAWVRFVLSPHVAGLLANAGGLQDLLNAANAMLGLRNQIDMTAVQHGHGGNAEATYAGTLQYHERRIQLGHPLAPALTANIAMDYMWKAFEHARHDAMLPARQALVQQQHADTMVDAYWQVSQALGITAAAIVAHYTTQANWPGYTPP